MDEGVDPTHLSQGLMNKVAQSEQLQSMAAPEVLVLFEDWLEELETEVVMLAKKACTPEPSVLGKKIGDFRGRSLVFNNEAEKREKVVTTY